jgi:hypothetical protein
MPRERAFWMVLGSLVLVGLGAGLLTQQGADRPLALVAGAPSPGGQGSRTRIWREIRFEPRARIPAGEDAAMELPTLLRTASSGGVYILDSGRLQILRFSSEGRLLARYAHASMGNPTDVAIGGGGEVWVCDPDRKVIVVFTPEGKLLRRITPRPPAARLVCGPGDGFVATGVTGGQGLFRRYSAAGEMEGSFGAMFAEDLQSSLAADGWIVSTSDFLVYLFRNAGLLISYTMDGRLRFFRETIAPVPLPMVHVNGAGRASVEREAPLASISGSIVGDELYILSDAAPGGRAIDVYETGQGSYRYSLRPPEADARYVLVTGDHLYSASRRGVTIWGWRGPEKALPGVEARRAH